MTHPPQIKMLYISLLIYTAIAIFLCSLFLTGCTLHFKGKELEIDTETKGAQIANLIENNHTFELAMVDIFKDAVLTPSDPPR